MQKLLLFFLLIGGAIFAQTPQGICKITKTSPDKSPKAKVTFRFVNPAGKPATSNVGMKINDGNYMEPQIDKKTGTHVLTVDPGTYNFKFYVQFWNDIISKPIELKAKTNTFVLVKFDAKDIGSAPVK